MREPAREGSKIAADADNVELGNGAPLADQYDVVVVGSGLGGLSAAAFLADAGKSVLVAERAPALGGYAHSFDRGPYHFDPAIHTIGQGEGLLLTKLFDHLGVGDLCQFVRSNRFYGAVFPGFSATTAAGRDEYVESLTRHFPAEEQPLLEFLALCGQIHRDVHSLPPALSLAALDAAVAQHPVLFKYLNASVGTLLDETLSEPRLKALVGAVWPYFGLPPDRLSVLTWSTPLLSLVEDGVFQCEGGAQALVDALAEAVRRRNGELRTGCEVASIVVEDGTAVGVLLADGRRIESKVVVSNADGYRTYSELVGFEGLPPPFVRRLERMRPSLSAFQLYLVTTLPLDDLDLAPSVFVYDGWEHDSTYEQILGGTPRAVWVNFPSLTDDSLAPAGESVIVATALAPYDVGEPWPAAAERYAQLVLEKIDRAAPGVSGALTHVEAATPLTLERYASSWRGAIYGWEPSPDQAGSRRLGHRGPIDGLYLSGQWTQPGAGTFRVIFSGIETTLAILGGDHADAFLRSIGLLSAPA